MRHMRFNALGALALVACFVVSPMMPSVNAQSAIPQPYFRSQEIAKPDTDQGELSRVDNYLGDKLFRRVIIYRDGRHSTTEYLPSGKPKSELVRSKDGKTTTIKLFNQGSEGGLFRISVITDGKVEQFDYREDGVTLWVKQTITGTDRVSEYFDDAGKLKVKREFERTGYMKVTVFDGSGAVDYTQYWRPGTAGYILDHLLEPIGDGKSRKVILDGNQVKGCDYLDQAGALVRSEGFDQLSVPIDKTRLKEFAPDDDPTVPGQKIPASRVKR